MRLCYFLVLLTALQAQTPASPDEHNPEALAEKSKHAKQAMLESRYPEAVALYRELVKALPENPGLRLNLAIALDKAGHPSAVIPEAERVTRVSPSSAPAWFLLGLAYQQLNQPHNAIAPLREAVRLEPNNADARLELADAEFTTGAAGNAARDFAALAALKPGMPKAWEGLGRAYLSLGENAFNELLKQAPESPYYLALLARSRASQERYGDGLALLAAAIEKAPDLPGLHATRAEIYRQAGHGDWAAIEMQRESQVPRPDCSRRPAACDWLAAEWQRVLSSSANSQSAENLYWTALASSHLAEESFERLAALPQSPEIHAVLADAYQRLGRRLDAVAEWRRAVELNPSDSLLQARLADSMVRARIYPEAERILNTLVGRRPENGEWQYLLGNVLLQMRRDDEALPHLLIATERMPNLLPADEALGRVYLDLGKPSEAVAHLEKARSLDDGSISFALSSAYRQLGRADEARAALARYRALTRQRTAEPDAPVPSP